MKPLLVGEANPYGSDPYFALYPDPPNSAGGRLCRKVLGLAEDDYLERFDRVNLCPRTWSWKQARARAADIVLERRGTGAPVVLLGAKVAAAFGLSFRPFSFVGGGGLGMLDGIPRHVMLQHPSGRSRAWNFPGAYERAREVLRGAGALPAA